MGNQDLEPTIFQFGFGRSDRGGELDCSGEDDVCGLETEFDGADEAVDVDGDVNEDVETGDGADLDGD